MISDGIRICDICKEEIEKGVTYRKAIMPPQAAVLLTGTDDPDVRPTWSLNSNGNVEMDICLTCTFSMGKAPGKEELN